MEDIMQERGPIAISYWVKVIDISSKKMHGVKVHPTGMHSFTYPMWKES